MRNRLWILFHLGTVAVLALLTIANVASWMRPFATTGDVAPHDAAQTLGRASGGNADRSPAAVTSAFAANSKAALKIALVGCEPNVRLRVFESVRQIRLQFDSCRDSKKEIGKDEVTGALNLTNGFEATVFGTAGARLAQAEIERAAAFEPAAGTFSPSADAAVPKKRAIASDNSKAAKIISGSNSQISTDYISLAPGANQIKIVRAGREQMLSIERK